ncbi:MAG: FAD:protein FMN transferase [Woeseia sp.]
MREPAKVLYPRRMVSGAFFAALLLAGCGREPAPFYELSGATMGTRFNVKVAQPVDEAERSELQQEIDRALDRIENAMSTYILRSDISKFNTSPSTDWIEVSAITCNAVEAALGISRLTAGAFDVTVGPLVNLWGFGPDSVRMEPPSQVEIETARERVGYERLHADCEQPALRKERPDLYVDLSAYAKGLAVDKVASLLDSYGIRRYLVEIGGELRMRGAAPGRDLWAVAIETPADTGRAVGRLLRLTDKAMATSGDYRNFFQFAGKRYSHTIDPRSGLPTAHELASVSVVSDTAAMADALATALLILGPKEGYDLALRQQIPAYFQLRTSGGFEERMTPAFNALDAAGTAAE